MVADDDKKYVSKELFEYVVESMTERIKDLEENQKWLVRTVGGSILLAIMSLILIGKKTGAL